MRGCVLFGIATVAGVAGASSARAYHFDVRFVEAGLPIDPWPIPNNGSLLILPGTTHRIRFQMGVFDDAAGAAPAGGFIGWNVGTLDVSGGTNTRTPGRRPPWNFAPNPPGNGLPSTDPFTALTAIDATLGTQTWLWGCDIPEPPLLPPPAVIRGRNTFASLFEFTTVAGTTDYDAVFAGDQIAASGWSVVVLVPPDCPLLPGFVTYAPTTVPPAPFTATLHIVVPAPGAAGLLCLAGLSVLGPRRARRGRAGGAP